MRDQIFFVATYGSIYDKVLPLIHEKEEQDNITIVVINDSLERFFKEYTNFRIIRLHVNPNLITQKTKHKLISNIIKSKLEYRKYFKNTHDADIHFFNRSYTIVPFSYIKKLTKNNRVYQYCDAELAGAFPVMHGLLPLVMRSVSKIFLNVDIRVENTHMQSVCILHEKFYKNIDRKSNKKFDASISNIYVNKIKQLKNKNILILSSNLAVVGFMTEEEIIKTTNILMSVLKARYDDIIIKTHPTDDFVIYGDMDKISDFVPSYIAAEFLVSHNWEFVIGIVSTALLTFAKNPKIKVISLIKMLEWKDTVMRDYWLDRYGKLPVLMPKNEEELKEVILAEQEKTCH